MTGEDPESGVTKSSNGEKGGGKSPAAAAVGSMQVIQVCIKVDMNFTLFT
jgi:hypothetical protein